MQTPSERFVGAVRELTIRTEGQGLVEITGKIQEVIRRSEVKEGLCTIFVQHTSASLTIQENADPSVRRDLQAFLNKLIPENDPIYTHTFEGDDDMPSHIKSALTATSLSIPVVDGQIALGTWQGIYLWEHRSARHFRKVLVHVG